MSFPFSIRYDKPINAIITADNQQEVLEYIRARILEKKANNIIIKGNQVSYKGSTGGRQSLFITVDNGVFTLISIDNNWHLIYEINRKSLFFYSIAIGVITSIMGQIMSGIWWIGFIYFTFGYGLNWLIGSAMNENLLTGITKGIDQLFRTTPVSREEDTPKEDNDKLKSWF